MKTRTEFQGELDHLQAEYIQKMHEVVKEARHQNVSSDDVAGRLKELQAEYVDKYQRLAFNAYKHSDLRV